jgi:hypothetical protein
MTDTTVLALGFGAIVSSGMGHYGTSEAIIQAIGLGWMPADRDELLALAFTEQATGYLGVTLEDANIARAHAGLPILDEDTLADQSGFDVFEHLVSGVDDAEAWIGSNLHMPCSCAYVGWQDGEWGVWSVVNSDGSDDECEDGEACAAERY